MSAVGCDSGRTLVLAETLLQLKLDDHFGAAVSCTGVSCINTIRPSLQLTNALPPLNSGTCRTAVPAWKVWLACPQTTAKHCMISKHPNGFAARHPAAIQMSHRKAGCPGMPLPQPPPAWRRPRLSA